MTVMAITKLKAEVLPPVVELTPEEEWADFDANARARLGISGQEFLRRLDAGEYAEIVDDPINHPGVSYLAYLAPVARACFDQGGS
jgi:hypothetical protein